MKKLPEKILLVDIENSPILGFSWIDMPKISPETEACRNCGGRQVKNGVRMTLKGRVQQYQCVDCGHWSRSKIIVTLD